MEFSDQPSSFSSALLRDISNFKTPSRPSRKPGFQSPNPQVFTASKQTPLPVPSTARHASRTSLAPPRSRQKQSATAAASHRKLKAFELEQSRSSRKVLLRKEQNLRTLAKSLTAWLNFLFRNPRLCGCDLWMGSDGRGDEGNAVKGKRREEGGKGKNDREKGAGGERGRGSDKGPTLLMCPHLNGYGVNADVYSRST